jgi:hypothetical protein
VVVRRATAALLRPAGSGGGALPAFVVVRRTADGTGTPAANCSVSYDPLFYPISQTLSYSVFQSYTKVLYSTTYFRVKKKNSSIKGETWQIIKDSV